MIKLDEQYMAEKIADKTYRIDENGVANCYLLIGEEKALLIDTGCGSGNLKQTVKKLTKKPLIVAVTHRHPDHVGGAWQFGEYYMHKDDKKLLYGIMSLPFVSKKMLKMLGNKKKQHLRRRYARIRRMGDGYSFELGNRNILVKSVPGHTRGSVVYLDETSHLMFTGDNTNYCLWMHLPGATSLERWLLSMKMILDYCDMGYTAYGGHSLGIQSKEELRTIYELVRKIVCKNREEKEKILDNHNPVILYKKNRIFEKKAKG